MINLYKNIKALRQQNQWTQEELAKKMGYTDRSMIAKIESGKVDLARSKIIEFAKVFNVSPGDLMDDEWDEAEAFDNPATFEIEWRKRGGAAHRLILTKEEEEFILKVRSIKSFDADCLKRLLKYVISIEELYNANRQKTTIRELPCSSILT